MSQKLLVNDVKWVEDISEFNESFMKVITKKIMKDINLRLCSLS